MGEHNRCAQNKISERSGLATNDLPQRISEHVRHINELMSGETKSINRSGFWQSTALLLEGIAGINAAPDMEILAEAPRGREAVQLFKARRPTSR
jgi:hypothetical protein